MLKLKKENLYYDNFVTHYDLIVSGIRDVGDSRGLIILLLVNFWVIGIYAINSFLNSIREMPISISLLHIVPQSMMEGSLI